MKPILECKGLSKKYNAAYYALANLNLSLEPGQIVGLLGQTEAARQRSSSSSTIFSFQQRERCS